MTLAVLLGSMSHHAFQVACEIEPPTRPDLMHVRHQIGTLSKVADSFLIPDNHLGRATVSSVAVAHEVEAMGGRSIACLNSRDRNMLGFRRDLLTAAAYGVGQFLFVYGDKPTSGGRTGELTVQAMMDELRRLPGDPAFAGAPLFPVGTAAPLRALPAWKRAADFLFIQVSLSLAALLRWREANPVELPVFVGVMTLASEAHAMRLAAAIPDIDIPTSLIEQVRSDRVAGVEATCDLVVQIRDSGAFDGVHLIPVGRYREVAARLEQRLR
jgi:5,10-methylenetetrahydrofolate reductase